MFGINLLHNLAVCYKDNGVYLEEGFINRESAKIYIDFLKECNGFKQPVRYTAIRIRELKSVNNRLRQLGNTGQLVEEIISDVFICNPDYK